MSFKEAITNRVLYLLISESLYIGITQKVDCLVIHQQTPVFDSIANTCMNSTLHFLIQLHIFINICSSYIKINIPEIGSSRYRQFQSTNLLESCINDGNIRRFSKTSNYLLFDYISTSAVVPCNRQPLVTNVHKWSLIPYRCYTWEIPNNNEQQIINVVINLASYIKIILVIKSQNTTKDKALPWFCWM